MFDSNAGGAVDEFVETNPAVSFSQRSNVQVMVRVVDHEVAESGSHTVYRIQVSMVSTDVERDVVSEWEMKRRYSYFNKLHQALKENKFPCPELPPKQLLWTTFNQSSFLRQRSLALNIWLQGTICIWQSIRLDDHRASFAIAELLEEFLCDDHAFGVSSPFRFSSPESTKPKATHVGVTIRTESLSYEDEETYATYAVDGQSMINHTFRPFTTTVKFPSNFQSSPNISSSNCCCTPVSVPPTPHGQHEFLNSWSKYTETVLAYVARRLENNEDHEKEEHQDFYNVEIEEAVMYNSSAFVFSNKKEKSAVDLFGINLVDRLLSESESSIDFVGSRWHLLGEERNVVILRRMQKKKPVERVLTNTMESETVGCNDVHCFLGRGMIAASAVRVYELIKDPLRRHLFDRMFRSGSQKVIETLPNSSLNPVAMQFTMETKQRLFFLRHARDCCVIQYSTQLNDGRYVVVGSSVKHSECSQHDIRANIFLYGWVIEPAKDDTCKATYLFEVDFGETPTSAKLLDTMAFRQPLCIHYVNTVLKKVI